MTIFVTRDYAKSAQKKLNCHFDIAFLPVLHHFDKNGMIGTQSNLSDKNNENIFLPCEVSKSSITGFFEKFFEKKFQTGTDLAIYI